MTCHMLARDVVHKQHAASSSEVNTGSGRVINTMAALLSLELFIEKEEDQRKIG